MSATSSRPSAGRRCVRSPEPEPIAAIASRTCESRRNAVPVRATTTAEASSTIATNTIAKVTSSERIPAIASASSIATTSRQSVPAIGCARNNLLAPPMRATNGLSVASSAASGRFARSGDSVDKALPVSAASGCATIWPLPSTSIAKLPGVGRIDFTFAITLSIVTSPLTTAFNWPSRITGTAKVTTTLPVRASA